MTRDEIFSVIEGFFDVIEGRDSIDKRERKLQLALDRLALAYHFVEYEFDETEYADAPSTEYDELRAVIGSSFPELGYYNIAQDVSIKIAETSVVVGDAIDDICDIAIDLKEVLWCWENTSIDDALWHFEQMYEYHWGHHLRELQLYLLKKTLDQ